MSPDALVSLGALAKTPDDRALIRDAFTEYSSDRPPDERNERMKIANEFTISAPIEQAWDVLTDLEQVVPLMPGAQLDRPGGRRLPRQGQGQGRTRHQ